MNPERITQVANTVVKLVISKGVATTQKPLEEIEAYFGKVQDPRIDRTKDHNLIV